MKKHLGLLVLGIGIFFLPHLSFASTLLYSQTAWDGTSSNYGPGLSSSYIVNDTVSSTDLYIYEAPQSGWTCSPGGGYFIPIEISFPIFNYQSFNIDCSDFPTPDGNFHWYHFIWDGTSSQWPIATTTYFAGSNALELAIEQNLGFGLFNWPNIAQNSPGGASVLEYYNGLGTPPPEFSSLQQYESDATTTISEGSTTTTSTVVFGATLESSGTSTLQLQVEVEPSSTAFTNTSTVESDLVSPGTYVTVPSRVLLDGAYHWQARVVDTEGNTSPWQTFNGTSTGTDFVVNGFPVAVNQSALDTVCPGLSSSTRNLVFITHGWNDNATDTDGWVQQMKDAIDSKLPNSSWGVCTYDWSGSADFPLTPNPWLAFDKAQGIGMNIGKVLAQQNYTSIHFIAHSAGANLIQNAAAWIEENMSPLSRPTIQLTFLAAYAPWSNGSLYGKNPEGVTTTNWWAEQYVDTRDPFDILFGANLSLSNAYNFDVTPLDPNQGLAPTDTILSYPFRVHAWPHVWYQDSIVSSTDYTYGFPLSLEENSSSLPTQYLSGVDCVLTAENTSCPTTPSTTISFSDTNLAGFSVENSTLDDSFTDATATITYPSSTSVELFSGSPVWIKVTTTTTNPYNIINFHYAFESASGSQGMFSLSVDNQVVDILDERVATSGDESDVFIGNLAPGPHTFAFRLDPYTDVQSVIELSNMQLGYLQETTSTYAPSPTISSFSASSSSILSGASSTLSWNITNASSVAITPGSFSTSTLIGSTTVSPTSTTIYTLTASNANGTSTATTTVTVTSSPWYSSSWLYRQAITINHSEVNATSGTTLTNFPVEINPASDTNLSAHASSTGADILFTDSDGTTKLSHEIESYVSSTGALVAWVTIPSLSASSDHQIYMYFGNASNTIPQQSTTSTWDNNFVGVYHFNSPDGVLSTNDSTINGNNGSAEGIPPTSTIGIADGALLTNDDQAISIPSSTSLNITSTITMECWMKNAQLTPEFAPDTCIESDIGDGAGYGLDLMGGDSSTTYVEAYNNVSGTNYGVNWYNGPDTPITLVTDMWNQYVGTYDGSTWRAYMNGTLVASDTSANSPLGDSYGVNIGHTSVGGSSGFSNLYNVGIDEVRISNIARSPDWIDTDYNNIADPSAFETVGDVEEE